MSHNNKKIFNQLKEHHIAIPYIYRPNNKTDCKNCCINWLTSWNYCWTRGSQIHNKTDLERPILLSFGNRDPLSYQNLLINTDDKISVNGSLGPETSVDYEVMDLELSEESPRNNERLTKVIVMSYVRYGAKASFILLNKENLAKKELIEKQYGSYPNYPLCGCCCLSHIRNEPVYDPPKQMLTIVSDEIIR